MSDKDWGWISVHRRIFDNWLWQDKPFSKGQAWIDLCLLANSSDEKMLLGNELIEVKRGSKVTSLRKLSLRWGWSIKKVNNFLDLLESDNMIVVKRNTKRTAYTIVNYNDYQDIDSSKRNTKETQREHEGNTKETRRKTNNKINKINNINNINKIDAEKFIKKWNENFKEKINQSNLNQSINQLSNYSSEEIFNVLDKATKSNYLLGLTENNNRGLTFNFFTKPNNFEKIKSGAYDTFESAKENKNKKETATKAPLYQKDLRDDEKARRDFIEMKLKQKIPIKIKNKEK